jgi:uncharacterized protein (DUF58 family)
VIPKELLAALRTIEIHTARLANEQLSGTYHSGFKGQGLAFREVRPYQAGDDVRTIDWNVSARMQDTFVKVFVEEREMTVMLVVDLSASERFGTKRAPKLRVASEVAALLAFSAIRNNDRVGLIVATDKIERIVPPKKGEKHVMRVVREILGFEQPDRATTAVLAAKKSTLGAATDLKAALETLVRGGAASPSWSATSTTPDTSARSPLLRRSTTWCPWSWPTRGTPSSPTWAWRASRTSRAARPWSSTRATRACAPSTRRR